MCFYYRFKYACGCFSKLYIQRCPQCIFTRELPCEDTEYHGDKDRDSFSPCYDCIYREWAQEQVEGLKAKMHEEKNPASQDNIRTALERLVEKKQKGEEKRIKAQEDVECMEDPKVKNDDAKSPDARGFQKEGHAVSSVDSPVKRQMARVGSFGTVGPLSAPPAPASGFGASKMGLFGREVEAPVRKDEEGVGDEDGSGVIGSGAVKILARNSVKIHKEDGFNEGKNNKEASDVANGAAKGEVNECVDGELEGGKNNGVNKEGVKEAAQEATNGNNNGAVQEVANGATNGGSHKTIQNGGKKAVKNGSTAKGSPVKNGNTTHGSPVKNGSTTTKNGTPNRASNGTTVTVTNEAKTPVKDRTNDKHNGNDNGNDYSTPSPKRDIKTNPRPGDEGYIKRCTKGLRSPQAHRAMKVSSWRKE
ncbi:hypothetical protein DM02DRAFT_698498 [Periconia macrospinosa]|uniref:Uncharacterized protein n=1 Tax=Periconia macrospinosa TaxID=97972 RepID=A0A2V1DY93_9PLEO|nr:hypothetical protein DM02DRAFT_698498 [Periconia macrospinosa]